MKKRYVCFYLLALVIVILAMPTAIWPWFTNLGEEEQLYGVVSLTLGLCLSLFLGLATSSEPSKINPEVSFGIGYIPFRLVAGIGVILALGLTFFAIAIAEEPTTMVVTPLASLFGYFLLAPVSYFFTQRKKQTDDADWV